MFDEEIGLSTNRTTLAVALWLWMLPASASAEWAFTAAAPGPVWCATLALLVGLAAWKGLSHMLPKGLRSKPAPPSLLTASMSGGSEGRSGASHRRRHDGSPPLLIAPVAAPASPAEADIPPRRRVPCEPSPPVVVAAPRVESWPLRGDQDDVPTMDAPAPLSLAGEARDDDGYLELRTVRDLRLLGSQAGDDFAQELLSTFDRDAEAGLIALRMCADSADLDGFLRVAHGVQGACSAVGARQMEQICAAAQQDDRGQLADLVDKLEATRGPTQRALCVALLTGDA